MKNFSKFIALTLACLFAHVFASSADTYAADTQTNSKSSKDTHTYAVKLSAKLVPESKTAEVALRVTQDSRALRRVVFDAPEDQFSNFRAKSGKLKRVGDEVQWQPPSKGGTLRYSAKLNLRRGSGYDARITEQWALLRFEDLLPPIRRTTIKGAKGDFRLRLSGPEDWAFETRYGRLDGRGSTRSLLLSNPGDSLIRPTGWLIAGTLGVRRESIADRAVTVAAPTGLGFPRIPTLAFLRWTLPEFVDAMPMLGDRLLVVSGDDSMWRGALSGPDSLYMHNTRPLISENSTSPLLHELVHVALRLSGKEGADWVVEGLAEYYSLEILRRADGISQRRFDDAIQGLEDWVEKDDGRLAHPSKGVDSAKATLVMHDIAKELDRALKKTRKKSDPPGMDQVINKLVDEDAGHERISVKKFARSVEKVLGKPSKVLKKALEEAE